MKIADFAFAADGNYVMPLRVAVASLLHACRHNPRPLTVHVLDLGISDSDWAALTVNWSSLMPSARFARHSVSAEKYAEYMVWNGSVAPYARLELPMLLPDVEWCMYFDCDVWVMRDPAELERLCDDRLAMLGHVNFEPMTIRKDGPWLVERGLPFDCKSYVCSGVVILNLAWFRRTGAWKSCFEFLSRYPNPVAVDQTVLNVVCFGHVGLLPSGWGEFSVEAVESGNLGCLHYSGPVPWRAHRGWFYFSGEQELEAAWRRFAVNYAGCKPEDFEELSGFRRAFDLSCAGLVKLVVKLTLLAGLCPETKKARMRRFLRRGKIGLVERIEEEVFS